MKTLSVPARSSQQKMEPHMRKTWVLLCAQQQLKTVVERKGGYKDDG